MIVKTEAVVLNGMKFRESSKILRLYTRDFGKVSVIAKGARQPKGRFGSALEPMSHVTAVFYKKEHRELQLLAQCDLIASFWHITDAVERLAPAMAVVELVDSATHAEEANERLYTALVEALRALNEIPRNHAHVLHAFELRFSDLLGFRPNLSTCTRCGRPLDVEAVSSSGAELHLSAGGVLCVDCSGQALTPETISWEVLHGLQKLQQVKELAEAAAIEMTPRVQGEVHTILHRYLQMHVAGFERLRSEGVFESMV